MFDVLCPTCNSLIRIKSEPYSGQFISCTTCKGVFHLVAINPLKLERLNVEWSLPASRTEPGSEKNNRNRRHNARKYDEDEDFEEMRLERRSRKSKKRDRYFGND